MIDNITSFTSVVRMWTRPVLKLAFVTFLSFFLFIQEVSGQCLDPEQFECKSDDESVCLNKTTNQCNGEVDCDDGRDESPSVCDS